MTSYFTASILAEKERIVTMKLHNKRIVITGGTSGVGYEMVQALHEKNELIVISKSDGKLKALKSEYENIITYQVDLSNLEEVKVVGEEIASRFEHIDILINNAAVQNTPTFLDDDFSYKNISTEISLNFTSVCSLIYLLLPNLIHEDEAVILNINSGLGLSPKTNSAIYNGTKGALNIFSQSLRYQLEDTNITVQQVFLPLIDTQMTKGRGTKKMTPKDACYVILEGVTKGILDHDIGKVKMLRLLLRIAPSLAQKIMKNI